MANYLTVRETRTQGSIIDRAFVGGQEAEFIFGQGTQLFPNLPVPIWGRTSSRVVDDAGEKWFELGFTMDHLLSGNPAAGWNDAGNYFRIDYEFSHDLVTWAAGKFVNAPTPVINTGHGTWQYWARALNPVDAAVKSGNIVVSSGFNGQLGDIGNNDTRNNPFTAMTIAGVAQALGGFPYTMPTDAARMQINIRALGWTGATVEASSATVWRIIIPGVSYILYSQFSKVFWPVYLVADMFGVINNPIDGADLTGLMVDAAGTPIFNKAFGRLKFSTGSRYKP